MRSVKSLSDVQIVLNKINNRIKLQDNHPKNQRGLQIRNAGDATASQDLVTLSQVKKLIEESKTTAAQVPIQHSTVTYTNPGTPTVNDTIPVYGFATQPQSGSPVVVWATAADFSKATGPTSFQILQNGNPILTTPLILPANSGTMVQTSQFISPVPYFGVGHSATIKVIAAGGHAGVAVGMTLRKGRELLK